MIAIVARSADLVDGSGVEIVTWLVTRGVEVNVGDGTQRAVLAKARIIDKISMSNIRNRYGYGKIRRYAVSGGIKNKCADDRIVSNSCCIICIDKIVCINTFTAASICKTGECKVARFKYP
ncbi:MULTISPECIES: hypothetical protein [unclassified Mesorhizobium]|uniref:hypothetical protein n=1 Tax=unclassified Mesorhizobium TaxID=325217 RepID=UPI001AECF0ED|nr:MULTISPECIES: hypothetical protein [unclassified Mesorhizobium]